MGNRRLAAEPLMRTLDVVVVLDELAEEPLEMSLAQRNDVIGKLAPELSLIHI